MKVGDGATVYYWSDRHAATIVGIKGRSVFVQEDIAKRIDKGGMSEMQEYEYSPNPNAVVQEFTLRKNGRWIKKGEPQNRGTALGIGVRRQYYDFSF